MYSKFARQVIKKNRTLEVKPSQRVNLGEQGFGFRVSGGGCCRRLQISASEEFSSGMTQSACSLSCSSASAYPNVQSLECRVHGLGSLFELN